MYVYTLVYFVVCAELIFQMNSSCQCMLTHVAITHSTYNTTGFHTRVTWLEQHKQLLQIDSRMYLRRCLRDSQLRSESMFVTYPGVFVE